MVPRGSLKLVLACVWLLGALLLASPPFFPAAASVESHQKVSEHVSTGGANCAGCHGKLTARKVVHPPAAEGCDSCHDFREKGGKAAVKLAAPAGELCFTCHADKQEQLKAKRSQHPPAFDSCTSCHDPHSADAPRLLKAGGADLCYACHADRQEEAEKKKFVHEPTKDIGCAACHDPHASDFAPALRGAVNDLCLACHGLGGKGAAVSAVLTGSSVPKGYADGAQKIVLGADGLGHPVVGHPVSGVPDPSRKGQALSCSSCHSPHAGNTRQMYRGDLRGQQLCDACHK